jgi:hypothetical protein
MSVVEKSTPLPADELTHDQLVERAREVGQLAWSQIAQTEADRRLPAAVIEALFDFAADGRPRGSPHDAR